MNEVFTMAMEISSETAPVPFFNAQQKFNTYGPEIRVHQRMRTLYPGIPKVGRRATGPIR